MSAPWTDEGASTLLNAEEIRLERLLEDLARGRSTVTHRRAQRDLDDVRARAAGIAEIIEKAALQDDTPALRKAQGAIREMREIIERQEDTIAHLVAERNIDPLTGCLDRRGFDDTLGAEWNRAVRGGTSVALVFIDVDAFKEVNDKYGHQGGDAALRAIAAAIESEAKRSGEAVSRWGGDEFAVVVPQAELAGALAFGERVRTAVAGIRLRDGATTIPLSVSVGVASVTPSLSIKREELLRRADRAVYRAKEAGRGCSVALDVENGVDAYFTATPVKAVVERTEIARTASRAR